VVTVRLLYTIQDAANQEAFRPKIGEPETE